MKHIRPNILHVENWLNGRENEGEKKEYKKVLASVIFYVRIDSFRFFYNRFLSIVKIIFRHHSVIDERMAIILTNGKPFLCTSFLSFEIQWKVSKECRVSLSHHCVLCQLTILDITYIFCCFLFILLSLVFFSFVLFFIFVKLNGTKRLMLASNTRKKSYKKSGW